MLLEDTRRAQRELEHRLRPFVARRVPASDVEDVLQEVFLRVHRALPDLKDEERFAPWLFRIARNAVSEHHRQRARQPLLTEGNAPDTELVTESNEPSAIEQELAAYIVPYIAELPSPYREALTLTELEGMTQTAAADALGISLSAMKSRVQRGREKLREIVEACCRIGLDSRGHVIECQPRDSSDCRCKGS